MREDLGDIIKRDEMNMIARDIDKFKKDIGRLCTKEELMTRLNVFNSDINTKLHDRPTISYFKKVLSAYD
jgi:ABC-type phosphate/phosphonate transport system ATPase subunit